MSNQADHEELLGVRLDGQGDRPDGTMWMVAMAAYGNIAAMDEVSQSELLVFLICKFSNFSARPLPTPAGPLTWTGWSGGCSPPKR